MTSCDATIQKMVHMWYQFDAFRWLHDPTWPQQLAPADPNGWMDGWMDGCDWMDEWKKGCHWMTTERKKSKLPVFAALQMRGVHLPLI